MINLYPNVSALNAFSVGMHGTAYNIANVNTDKFQPVAVHYQSGKPADLGVQPVVTRPPSESAAPAPCNELEASWAKVPQSNVELSREFTNMIINQRGFEANAVTIRTGDEILGTVLDLKA